MKKLIILLLFSLSIFLLPGQSSAKTFIQTVQETHKVEKIKLSTSQEKDWGIGYTNIQKFWNKNYTGNGIKVAIIDTGIDYKHPDLKSNFYKGVSFIKNKNFVDDNGHGTHVAGIVAGKNNNIGFVGVAPNAKLYVAKALDKNGYGTVENLTKSVKWAIKNNVDIINMSIGLTSNEVGTKEFKNLENAINEAYSKGILIVAAAGNDNNKDVDYPAKFKNVISVGAITNYDPQLEKDRYVKSDFSNYGKDLEITAPGSFIYSTYPMNIKPFLYPVNGYEMLSGTSMAAPYVTGFLAVLQNRYPNDNNIKLRNHLHYHVKDLGKKGKDIYYGYGTIKVK